MKKEMLINVLQPEECRIAILEDGVLEELYVERTTHESYTGNIYLGKIVNLEPAIQASFVDFSVGRNGFLHVSDVEPQYYRRLLGDDTELPVRDRGREPRPEGREPRRDRDRGEARPPRGEGRPARDRDRDRDRDREEDRPARGEGRPSREVERPSRGEDRPSRGEDRPSSFGRGLLEPESEDRPRGRDRDRDRSRDEEAERPREREFGWDIDWDRPDRSEKPRRERPDRSEKRRERPRRFGEGLTDDLLGSEPSAPEPEPESQPVVEAAPEPEPREVPPPTEAESYLPPNRTQRGRKAARDAEPAAEAPAAEAEAAAEPAAEATSETPARERRRGRGRGRAARLPAEPEPAPPAAEPEPEPEPEPQPGPVAETPPALEPEPEPEIGGWAPRRRDRGRAATPPPPPPEPEPEIEPEPEPEPEFQVELGRDEPDRPRLRGREAIRARGGDRPAGRPRDRSDREPAPERPAARAPEPDWDPFAAPEAPARDDFEPARDRDRERPTARDRDKDRDRDRPAARDRDRDRERPAARDRDRERDRDKDRDRDRVKPHDRAGEPGYVPRRERAKTSDLPAESDPFDWGEETPSRRPPIDESIERLLIPDADEDRGDEDDEDEAGEGGRRRRRRRRRRRKGSREEAGAAGAEFDADVDPEADVDREEDEDEEEAPRRPRRAPARSRGRDRDRDEDDFDRDEDELDHEDDDFDREVLVDEEIEPELEEEIRREIEEIYELEREVGLRGTTEARPRGRDRDEASGRGDKVRARGGLKPPIQEIFRRGDEVLVQVIKESIGTKGPTLSTYISIPGRYLVLMPGLNRVGVSRKIADESQRRRLREIMTALNPPKGLGFIVRTAGLDRTKRELAKDLAYLLRLWKVILRRIKKAKAPAPIYQESDMIIRTIRDIFTPEIDTIWIDEPHAFERAQEFLKVVMPKYVHKLKFYDERVPLFHKYGLEDEIAKIQRRRVDLPGGGSIVIDPTEALVAIDVNSGNFRVEDDAERTAYEMNLRAAREIARQLRLRDLGGVIVNDFIDMRDEKHRRGVERALRDAVRRDRARTKILRMSQFGLVEMTRQRIRPSLKRSVYEDCSHCAGAGVVKTAESMAIDVIRLIALASNHPEVRRVNLTVCPAVETYLNNRKRREIARIETEADLVVHIRHEVGAPGEHLQMECYDAQNAEIRVLPSPPPAPRRGR